MPPVSARALPREQNERLRALLREIIAKDFDGGLTKAAERLGVAHATISDVLSGKRGVGQKLLSGLAEHTGRSLDDLVGRPAIVYDAAPVRRGSRVGQHPGYSAAAAELRRKLQRRGGGADETLMSDLEGLTLSRFVTVLTSDFLLRLYDALLQARDDNAENQGSDSTA